MASQRGRTGEEGGRTSLRRLTLFGGRRLDEPPFAPREAGASRQVRDANIDTGKQQRIAEAIEGERRFQEAGAAAALAAA